MTLQSSSHTLREMNGVVGSQQHPFEQQPEDVQGELGWDITLRILGEVASQGSKTLTRWGSMRESSKKLMPWRYSIQYATEQQYQGPLLTGPVEINVTFLFARPKNHWSESLSKIDQLKPSAPRHHSIAPDVDKLCRALLDGLSAKCGGNVLKDDSLVARITAEKRYAYAHESTGALVLLRTI